ncbi:MAG: rhomboid family protein [Verrucomicrobia bacterium]|nr:MAG: rhomboid family protein [Verrucomicrobiota bacterium]
MINLAHQRCFNHVQREAVARCPECRHFFCRECIAEHDSRVLCASCLRKLADTPSLGRQRLLGVRRIGQCLFGLLLAWFFFHLFGQALLALPTSFHEGTLWRANWLDD